MRARPVVPLSAMATSPDSMQDSTPLANPRARRLCEPKACQHDNPERHEPSQHEELRAALKRGPERCLLSYLQERDGERGGHRKDREVVWVGWAKE